MISLLFLGCAGGDFSAYLPTVKFNRLDLTGIDFDHIDVDFVFDVGNPNPIGIPLSRFDYSLGFEGIEVLSGNDPDGLALVADGSSELALPVGIEFANLFEAVAATRGLDYIGFGLAGNFGFDTDLGPVDIGFAEEGSFPALRTPTLSLGTLRIESADAETVLFGLDIDLDNDHGSTLDFTDLDFAVKFAGAHVGDGAMDAVAEVPGATTRTVTIPFGVDYLDALAALEAVIAGDRLAVELDAGMDVDTPFGVVPLTIDETGNVSVAD